MPTVRLDSFTLLLAAAAIAGTAHILVRTAPYGAILSGYDPAMYIVGAENLAAGAGFSGIAGGAIVAWPPFFSMLLALFALCGIEPADAGRFVNAAAFGLTILIAGLWLRRNTGSGIFALAGAAAVMTSWAVSSVFSNVQPDSIFILFTLFALMQLGAFLDRESSASRLPPAFAGLFAALASITRYVGVTVLFTGALAILMKREMPLMRRLRFAAVWGAASSVPLAVLLARNWAVSATLTGDRAAMASGQTLSDSLRQIVENFRWMLFPIAAFDGGYPLWAAVVPVVLGTAALVVVSRRKQKQQFRLSPILPFVLFASAYLALLAVIVPLTVEQGIDYRYLAPVHAPLILAAAFLLNGLLHSETRGMTAAVKWASAFVMLMICCASVGSNIKLNLDSTAVIMDPGYDGGYNYPKWKNSETTRYARANASGGDAYSNVPHALHLSAGAPIPVYGVPALQDPGDCLLWLRKSAESGSGYIVWWKQKYAAPPGCNIPMMESQFLERTAELADGSFYRLRVPDAVFSDDGAPAAGKAVGVSLAPHRQAAAGPEPWQWERGCAGAGWTKIAGSPGTGHEYTPSEEDVGLRLRAYTHYTNADGRRVKAATKPSKPVGAPPPISNLEAKAGGFDALTLTWTPPPRTPCPAFTGYQVEYRPADGGEWSRTTRGAAASGARLAGLQAETAYDVRVRAVTGWNEGPWSRARAAADTFSATLRSLQESDLLAGATFDIYLRERQLIYIKEPCSPTDTQASFLLHVVPADANDLPEGRRRHGFDNLDFIFARRGTLLDGKCMALAPLPEYAFTEINTGQFTSTGTVWNEIFSFPDGRRGHDETPNE